jgi:small subunit ribosomal protein S13
MVRFLGLVLPDNSRIEYALTLIYGIGFPLAKKILAQTKIDPQKRVKEVTEEEYKKITVAIEKNHLIEGELREEISENIKRLKDIGSYRGLRHIRALPVRGQRTKSNARTKRGKRKTVGALRKEAWAKLEQNKNTAAAAKKTN